MTDHRGIEEERRQALEAVFRTVDEQTLRAGVGPGARPDVDSVELSGSYPDTVFVIRGRDLAGDPIETREPVWGAQSWFEDNDLRTAVMMLLTHYVEG